MTFSTHILASDEDYGKLIEFAFVVVVAVIIGIGKLIKAAMEKPQRPAPPPLPPPQPPQHVPGQPFARPGARPGPPPVRLSQRRSATVKPRFVRPAALSRQPIAPAARQSVSLRERAAAALRAMAPTFALPRPAPPPPRQAPPQRAAAPEAAPAVPTAHRLQASAVNATLIRKTLRPQNLRALIALNEVLQPPLALREDGGRG